MSSIKPFEKILVANRSEIATRVFRAATELGLRTVAVYANEDRFSMHRFKADEAYPLNPEKGPVGAYLDIDGIVALAVEKGVDAIHPGYGFLSENPDFARACQAAGIAFIGPSPELLDQMGDKTAARAMAEQANIPTLPGTQEAIVDRDLAIMAAREIGFPLIIKAAFGGGGRGMRVVSSEDKLDALLDEAQSEARNSFGNPAVFLEKFIDRAKHIEVQIIGDHHGNVLHLHERDCSVQRRHQKVVEVAPSIDLPDETRIALCDAAVALSSSIGYNNAGTVEFLVDADTHEWFFIEMNPRIQVEHTVTEEITGVDLVATQILVAMGHKLHDERIALPPQDQVPRIGYAVQCRITTEDPEENFTPDYGRILTYRSAHGPGIRLDGGVGTTGATITPFYDSMLVKLIAHGRTFQHALDRTSRALREFRIRGLKTNIPFLENVIDHPTFREGRATTRLIDSTPELFTFKPRRDRATKLLNFLSDVTVNGNPHAKNIKPPTTFLPAKPPTYDHRQLPPKGSRDLLLELGPEGLCKWVTSQRQLLLTDTTLRDAHQSLLATRVRTYDMLAAAKAIARRTPQLFSLEMWGGATFDSAMRFLKEDPWQRLEELRTAIPNICFQMLFRGSNAVGYTNYPDAVVAGFIRHAASRGMDIFRVFDSLNYMENLEVAIETIREHTSAICEATICYTGDILDPKRDKYPLDYYVKHAKHLEHLGAHMICIKDMAGLCRPFAAEKLVRALKQEIGIPIHFHTHDTSGINASSILKAAEAGVDIADAALSSLSGSTSQPNLNSIVAALQHTERDTGLDLAALDEFSDYWAKVRTFYFPFDTSEPHGTAEVYLHEMPGGQYTNLKEQANAMGIGHRWPEIARTYAEVNQLFGDIVKVTPSSKVVGDMTMFLITHGVKAADVPNLPPNTPFPESVIDMLSGGLGQPEGGWPADVQKVILGDRIPIEVRPGLVAEPVDLDKTRALLAEELGRQPSEDDVYSYLMYPQVFLDLASHDARFSNVSILPTPAYFFGLAEGEEITAHIQEGKALIIKLLQKSDPDPDGRVTLIYELNGFARHVTVVDRSLATHVVERPKADPKDPLQIGAPMPGLVAQINVDAGQEVDEGTPLLTLEAMKMYTTINSPVDGIVAEICVEVGTKVESKDLIIRLA